MLSKIAHRLSLVIIGLLTAPVAQADVFGHHEPYQDQHFNLNSTPRSYSGAYTGGMSGISSECATCMNGPTGSRGGNVCPPVQNAILKLWVPDGMQVEVNGQPTKPQTLGGIHKNSRVFSLEGLYQDRVSPCTIVVIAGDEFGNLTRYYQDLSVQAGGHFEVRFPQQFKLISVPFETQMIETQMSAPMIESTFPSQMIENVIPGPLAPNTSQSILLD